MPAAPATDPLLESIVWDVRAPRTVLAPAVGAALALAGATLQTLVRNVLADPYVLGVNAGAGLGAAAALLFGAGAGLGRWAVQGSAFLGAAGACLVVALLARAAGNGGAAHLLLAGVAVGHLLAAVTSLLVFLSDSAEGTRSVVFWLLGSLAGASWGGPLALVVGVVVLGGAGLTAVGPRLDALGLGPHAARSLGLSIPTWNLALLVVTSLLVGTSVALAGSIGFVGLVAPHLARRLVGARHRRTLPASALIGATLLVWADVLARTLLAPQEIPIGVLTGIVGAPALLLLLRRAGRPGGLR